METQAPASSPELTPYSYQPPEIESYQSPEIVEVSNVQSKETLGGYAIEGTFSMELKLESSLQSLPAEIGPETNSESNEDKFDNELVQINSPEQADEVADAKGRISEEELTELPATDEEREVWKENFGEEWWKVAVEATDNETQEPFPSGSGGETMTEERARAMHRARLSVFGTWLDDARGSLESEDRAAEWLELKRACSEAKVIADIYEQSHVTVELMFAVAEFTGQKI